MNNRESRQDLRLQRIRKDTRFQKWKQQRSRKTFQKWSIFSGRTNFDKVQWYRIHLTNRGYLPESSVREYVENILPRGYFFNYSVQENDAIMYYCEEDISVSGMCSLPEHIARSQNSNNISITFVDEPLFCDLTDFPRSQIQSCIECRFDGETKRLNLSSLRKDINLLECGLYISLRCGIVIRYIVELLINGIDELHDVDLGDNQLESLFEFKDLFGKFTMLRRINISRNCLTCLEDLELISSCPIDSIDVRKNPLNPANQEAFIKVLQKLFPNLKELNNKQLPPTIKFGLPEIKEQSFPSSIVSFFPSMDVKKFIFSFLRKYYQLYDSNRADLWNMYCEDSVFTLCLSPSIRSVYQVTSRYDESQMRISRNMLRVWEYKDLQEMVHHGRLQVVGCLDRFPKTLHILDSIHVDVLKVTESSVMFSVTGVFFEEKNKADDVLRAFSRMFVLVPEDRIRIDNLLISHVLPQTVAKYGDSVRSFKTEPPFENDDFEGQSGASCSFVADSISEEESPVNVREIKREIEDDFESTSGMDL